MRRRLAVLIGALLTVTGAGAAVGVNSIVLRAVRLPEGAMVPIVAPLPSPGTAPEPVVASAPVRRTKAAYIDGILGRNIFDPDAIGRAVVGSSTGDMTLADLDVRLIGTIVAIPEQYSSALMAEATASPRGYGIGDKVQDAEIVKIEPDKVHVKRATGEIQVITMGGVEAPRPTTPSAGSEGTGEEGIEQVSETKFIIERSVYDRYLGDLDAISRMGRAIPHRGADGEIDGYRLSGVRRDSLGSKIGIKNGDIVHAVNGKPLVSMKDALDALGTLQSESAFQFDVTRRGQKVTLEYEVR